MNCTEAKEYLLTRPAEETPAMTSALTAHLASCRECAEVEQITRARQALLASRKESDVAVPPFFTAKVMAAIAARREQPVDGWTWIWQMARQTIPALATVMLLITLLSLGSSLNWFGEQPTAPTPELAALWELDNSTDSQNILFTAGGELNNDQILATLLAEGTSND